MTKGIIRKLRCAVYPGEHAAIIDRDLWDRVHAILGESPRTRSARTRAQTPTLLKGLLYGPGGAAFSPTHTRKKDRLYRYYASQAVLKHGRDRERRDRPAPRRVPSAGDRGRDLAGGREQDERLTEAEARDALLQLDPLWDELFPAEQARIVHLLVERVDIAEDGLDIRLRTAGLAGLVREFGVDARVAA